MTGPFNVDPNDVDSVAAQWMALREQFDRPPPTMTGSGPESQAARAAIAAAAASTAKLQADVGQTATTAQAGASAYTQQEGASAGSLEPKDQVGVMKDMIGVGTGLFGVLPQVIGAGTSLLGAGTGVIGSGAGVIGSLTGAAASGQKLEHPDEPHSGTGNPNNNNPEDNDYGHPA